MSLSRFLGVYYKLPKWDPNAVYLLPNAVYLLQCCFIAANIVWAGQCDNSLFPWKLYKIVQKLTAQQAINTAIKNWYYSTPRHFCNYCCQNSAGNISFKQIGFPTWQSPLLQIVCKIHAQCCVFMRMTSSEQGDLPFESTCIVWSTW